MSTVAFIRRCMEAGLSAEDALIAAEAFESLPAVPTKAAMRTRKWRENRASPNVTERHGDVCDAGDAPVTEPPLSRPLPPQTPLSPTHSPPECITTRAREDLAFSKFWLAYPRKTAKADARKAFGKAWRKLPPNDEEEILAGGLERAKAGWVDAQYIPHAATWLNGERWQDEIPPPEMTRQANGRQQQPPSDAKLDARHANYARSWAGSERASRLRGEP